MSVDQGSFCNKDLRHLRCFINPTDFCLSPRKAYDLDGSDEFLLDILSRTKTLLIDKTCDAEERVLEL